MKEQLILTETMVSLNDYLYKFTEGLNNLVNFLRIDKLEQAHEILVMLPEGLSWIYDVVRLTAYTLDTEEHIKLIEISNSINEAIENTDYNLLADILEYELLESCTNIKKKVEKFIA